MATNDQLVLLLAPEYANDPRLPVALELAELQVGPDHCYRAQVVVLLAAHALFSAGRAGAGGSVASKKEGLLEIKYHPETNPLLATSSFLDEVARLNRLCYGMTARTAWLDPPA